MVCFRGEETSARNYARSRYRGALSKYHRWNRQIYWSRWSSNIPKRQHEWWSWWKASGELVLSSSEHNINWIIQKTKLANSSGGFTEIIQRLELENKTLVEHVHNYSIEAEKFFIKEQELQTRLSSIQTEAEAYRQTIKKLEMELDDVTNNIVEAVKILKASRNDLQKENSTERFSDTTLTNGCTS